MQDLNILKKKSEARDETNESQTQMNTLSLFPSSKPTSGVPLFCNVLINIKNTNQSASSFPMSKSSLILVPKTKENRILPDELERN